MVFSEVHLRLCPNSSWFRTCDFVLAYICDGLRRVSINLNNLRNYYSVLSENDALRLDNLGLLDGGVLPGLLTRPATANRLSEFSLAAWFLSTFLCYVLIVLAELFTCAQGYSFCILSFTIFALNHSVDDHELYEVSVSLSMITSGCGAIWNDLSYKIIWSCPTTLAIHSAGTSPNWTTE